MPKNQTITASEIGTYTFCPRAWALGKRGYPSDNRQAMNEGTAFHQAFGIRTRLIRLAQVLLIAVMFDVLSKRQKR